MRFPVVALLLFAVLSCAYLPGRPKSGQSTLRGLHVQIKALRKENRAMTALVHRLMHREIRFTCKIESVYANGPRFLIPDASISECRRLRAVSAWMAKEYRAQQRKVRSAPRRAPGGGLYTWLK